MESAAKGKVCVTGGTGFVASWLIKKLLENGYSVTTTVRADPEKRKDYSFLTNLPGASEKLQIYQADLHDPNSFAPAIAGCIGVFHLATPIDVDDKEPVESLTRRTIEGTLGILKLSVDSKTREMEGGMKGKVCVTGGTGFIGSWLVKRLLEDGYSVSTTVRSDPGTSRI
uniref:NAD(P)-binding domain-containing protein n=1 Tax=Cucumis melo TaxID=3656 RepID=A0A9I9EL82_CUCME